MENSDAHTKQRQHFRKVWDILKKSVALGLRQRDLRNHLVKCWIRNNTTLLKDNTTLYGCCNSFILLQRNRESSHANKYDVKILNIIKLTDCTSIRKPASVILEISITRVTTSMACRLTHSQEFLYCTSRVAYKITIHRLY